MEILCTNVIFFWVLLFLPKTVETNVFSFKYAVMQSFSIYSFSLCTHIYEIVIVLYVKVCIFLFTILNYLSLSYSTIFSIPLFWEAYFIYIYFYHLIFMNCEMITTVGSVNIHLLIWIQWKKKRKKRKRIILILNTFLKSICFAHNFSPFFNWRNF